MSNLTSAIDQLGTLRAQIADLEKREAELKAIIVAQGAGAYEGNLYRVTVSQSERWGWDKVAKERIEQIAREQLSPQYITAHTTVTPVVTVRVVARNGLKLVA